MKRVIIFSLDDTDPANPTKNDLLTHGLIVGDVITESGSFASRTSTIFLIKFQHLLMPLFAG